MSPSPLRWGSPTGPYDPHDPAELSSGSANSPPPAGSILSHLPQISDVVAAANTCAFEGIKACRNYVAGDVVLCNEHMTEECRECRKCVDVKLHVGDLASPWIEVPPKVNANPWHANPWWHHHHKAEEAAAASASASSMAIAPHIPGESAAIPAASHTTITGASYTTITGVSVVDHQIAEDEAAAGSAAAGAL